MAKTAKVLTNDPVVLRILELIRKRRKKEIDLAGYLGIPTGSMAKWKYYGSTSYLRYVEEICIFLNTTPNYLFLGHEETVESLSFEEKDIIRMYRDLDEGRKNCIKETLRYLT